MYMDDKTKNNKRSVDDFEQQNLYKNKRKHEFKIKSKQNRIFTHVCKMQAKF